VLGYTGSHARFIVAHGDSGTFLLHRASVSPHEDLGTGAAVGPASLTSRAAVANEGGCCCALAVESSTFATPSMVPAANRPALAKPVGIVETWSVHLPSESSP
jgi:hypothetical protein